MGDTEMIGHPLNYGWFPHKPETWTYRFATLRLPVVMRHFTGKHLPSGPVFREVPLEAGARVKIVMVSRLGDVGITEDLNADNGYGARVQLDDLCNFGNQP